VNGKIAGKRDNAAQTLIISGVATRRSNRKWRELVPRYALVHFLAPAVYSARHAVASRYALFTQPRDYLQAPRPMMAVHNQIAFIRFAFERLHVCRDRVHGDEFRPFDSCERPLVRLPHVDKEQFFAGLLQGHYFLRRHFKGTGGSHNAPVYDIRQKLIVALAGYPGMFTGPHLLMSDVAR